MSSHLETLETLEALENNLKSPTDIEIWDWTQKEIRRLDVSVKHFLKILNLPYMECALKMYKNKPPTRKLHYGNLLMEKLKPLFGQDFTNLFEPTKTTNYRSDPIEKIIDVYYYNQEWMLNETGIFEVCSSKRSKDESECILWLNEEMDPDESLLLFKTKLEENGINTENITFRFIRTRYL